jgi:hypothetical protein
MDVLGFATLGFAFDGTPGEPVTPPPAASTGGGGFVGTRTLQTWRVTAQGGLRLRGASQARRIPQPPPVVHAMTTVGGLRLGGQSSITVIRSTRDLEDLALLGLARQP